MLLAVRHLLSILLLPFMVVVVVPSLLLPSAESRGGPLGVLGAALFVVGLVVFARCVALFALVGRGTLAPWDPTRELVAVGPYRFVRNPMISAVAAMLFGEAVYFGSTAVATWAVTFVAVNHLHFLLLEEPGLERRFGDSYREYKRRVPRWLPRLRSDGDVGSRQQR